MHTHGRVAPAARRVVWRTLRRRRAVRRAGTKSARTTGRCAADAFGIVDVGVRGDPDARGTVVAASKLGRAAREGRLTSGGRSAQPPDAEEGDVESRGATAATRRGSRQLPARRRPRRACLERAPSMAEDAEADEGGGRLRRTDSTSAGGGTGGVARRHASAAAAKPSGAATLARRRAQIAARRAASRGSATGGAPRGQHGRGGRRRRRRRPHAAMAVELVRRASATKHARKAGTAAGGGRRCAASSRRGVGGGRDRATAAASSGGGSVRWRRRARRRWSRAHSSKASVQRPRHARSRAMQLGIFAADDRRSPTPKLQARRRGEERGGAHRRARLHARDDNVG